MRRPVVLAGVLLAALLAGCADRPPPPGVDGDLIGGWPMLPAAVIVQPVAPACYVLPGNAASADVLRWPDPVPCTDAHQAELIAVGQFTGADAGAPIPPAPGRPALRTAYATCAAQADALLGADWRTGLVSLSVDPPSPSEWDAGVRWFRCDLQALQEIDRFAVATRTTSMHEALKAGGELLLGCAHVTTGAGSTIDRVTRAPCTAAHEGEFAGLFEPADTPYPADPQARHDANFAGCRAKVAAFAGVPDDANFRARTGVVTMPYDKAAWESGNRGVRCFVWPPKAVTRSLRGAGVQALPITVS